MITDAQVHLWEADLPERPWDPGAQAHLPEAMTVERFIALMDAAGVDRAVATEPAVSGFDPSYLLECAAKYAQRIAVMGRYDPDDPAGLGRLERWLETPGMIALRLSLFPTHWPRWQQQGTLDTFWPAVERLGIPVGLFSPTGLAGIESIVARHPGLKLTVDHMNLTGRAEGELEQRVQELEALARYPNVAVKLSALPLMSAERYPFADLHEPIKRVHAAFGARRLFWGGDQTQALAHNRATYSENVDMIRVVAAGFFPQADIDLILGDALAERWHWPV